MLAPKPIGVGAVCSGQRFGCQQCNRYYKSKEGLYNHQKYECGKSPQFQCPQCPFKSKLKETMARLFPPAMEVHWRGNYCPKCGKFYNVKKSYDKHVKFDCGMKRYLCIECPYATTRLSVFQPKILIKKHFCHQCRKSYVHRRGLWAHIRYECGKEPQFSCPFCTYATKLKAFFATSSSSRVHAQCIVVFPFSVLCTPLKGDTKKVNRSYDLSLKGTLQREVILRGYIQNQIKFFSGLDKRYWEALVNKFACTRCGREYIYKRNLVYHQRFECGKEPQFHCPYCPHRTKHKGSLKKHVITKHYGATALDLVKSRLKCSVKKSIRMVVLLFLYETYRMSLEKRYICASCGKRYKYPASLQAHQVEDKCGSGSYKCDTCNRVYRHSASLYTHRRHECGVEPQYNCPLCPYKSRQKGLEKRFKCENCHKSYRHAPTLYSHRKFECGKEPQFGCQHCPFKAKHKGSLKRHYFSRHFAPLNDMIYLTLSCSLDISQRYRKLRFKTYDLVLFRMLSDFISSFNGKECGEERPYVCDRCSKTYKYQSGLYIHQKYECNVEPQFACSYCSYRARQKEVTDPYAGNQDEFYQCPDCLKKYKYKSGLYQHRKHECGKEPQFQCPYCPYKGRQRGHLRSHVAVKHTVFSLAPIECSCCGKVYRTKPGLYNHQKYECGKESCRYSNASPYKCFGCGKNYKTRPGLYNHQKYECGKERLFFWNSWKDIPV
uniref:C2H2-type domain-containing protein n=1 Tax=Rhodnius prolixus TaxID=13249 RepID=T1HPZ6_RHOPR